ncbi:MAG: anti-sigma factor family protein [Candidatus Methylomirabilia bacterium]
MSCAERDRARLVDFLEGEMPRASAATLESHLEGCAECSAELTTLEASRVALGALPLDEPSEGSWEVLRVAISQRLDTESPSRIWRLRRLWPAVAIPLAAAAALLLVWRASPPPPKPESRVSLVALAGDPVLEVWLLETPVRELNRYAWVAPVLLGSSEGGELQELVRVADARQVALVPRVDQVMGLTEREIKHLVTALERRTSR